MNRFIICLLALTACGGSSTAATTHDTAGDADVSTETGSPESGSPANTNDEGAPGIDSGTATDDASDSGIYTEASTPDSGEVHGDSGTAADTYVPPPQDSGTVNDSAPDAPAAPCCTFIGNTQTPCGGWEQWDCTNGPTTAITSCVHTGGGAVWCCPTSFNANSNQCQ